MYYCNYLVKMENSRTPSPTDVVEESVETSVEVAEAGTQTMSYTLLEGNPTHSQAIRVPIEDVTDFNICQVCVTNRPITPRPCQCTFEVCEDCLCRWLRERMDLDPKCPHCGRRWIPEVMRSLVEHYPRLFRPITREEVQNAIETAVIRDFIRLICNYSLQQEEALERRIGEIPEQYEGQSLWNVMHQIHDSVVAHNDIPGICEHMISEFESRIRRIGLSESQRAIDERRMKELEDSVHALQLRSNRRSGEIQMLKTQVNVLQHENQRHRKANKLLARDLQRLQIALREGDSSVNIEPVERRVHFNPAVQKVLYEMASESEPSCSISLIQAVDSVNVPDSEQDEVIEISDSESDGGMHRRPPSPIPAVLEDAPMDISSEEDPGEDRSLYFRMLQNVREEHLGFSEESAPPLHAEGNIQPSTSRAAPSPELPSQFFDEPSTSSAPPMQIPQYWLCAPEECNYVIRIRVFARREPRPSDYEGQCDYVNITRNQRYNLVHRSFVSRSCTNQRPLENPTDVYIPWRIGSERIRAHSVADMVFYGDHPKTRPIFRTITLVTDDGAVRHDILMGRPFFCEFVCGYNPVREAYRGERTFNNLYIQDSDDFRYTLQHFRFGGGNFRKRVPDHVWKEIENQISTGRSGNPESSSDSE